MSRLMIVCLFVGTLATGCLSQRDGDMSEERASIESLLAEPGYDWEGFVDYRHEGYTYKLWCGRVGSGGNAAALVLHGGPGGNHHNLVAFQALAAERPVIFYDQLGCGKSDRPDDPSLWRAGRYFDEVRAVRDGLGLQAYHLIGHSWGTTLAVGFAGRHPEGILSISLHSPVLSFPYYVDHVAPELKQGLKGQAGQIIDAYELKGVGDKNDYREACLEFTRRHVTHTWPLPEAMKRLVGARNSTIHDVMVASHSELNVPGNLTTLDVTSQLSDLRVPVLMTCGDADLCTPAYTKWQAGFADDCRCHIIPGSAHMTAVDKPVELIRLQRAFLREIQNPSADRASGTQ